jgi:hypothetical protein
MKRNRYIRPNPPKGSIRLYKNVLEIRAEKGEESNWPGELFKHKFDEGAELFGCPDGSLRIIGKKPLWKIFEYSERDL